MASAGTVTVDFAAETAKFTAELKKVRSDLAGVKKSSDATAQSVEKITKGFKRLFGALALGAGLRAIIKNTQEAEQANALLANALERAGANVVAASADFADYATSLQKTTTFGDEAIIGVETLLLSFRGLSSGVIKRATADILDLSARTGVDLSAAARKVGRALEDPIQGLTLLKETGASFTAAQKEQVKALIEAGEKGKAQAVILGEIEARFKGAAAAAANTFGGALTGLKNDFGDLLEAKTGLPGVTTELNNLRSILQDPTTKQAADNLLAGLLNSLVAVTGFIGKTAAGLKILVTGKGGNEAVDTALQIEELQRKKDRLLAGFGGQDDTTTAGRLQIQFELDAINAQLDAALKKERDLLGLQRPGELAPVQVVGAKKLPVDFTTPDAAGPSDAEVERRKEFEKTRIALQEAITTEFEALDGLSAKTTDKLNDELQKRAQADLDYQGYVMENARKSAEFRAQIEDEAQSRIKAARELTLQTSLNALQLLGARSKTWAKVHKGLAIVEAIRNTYVGVTKALAQGGFWGIAQAAAVGALGFAQVAAIRSSDNGVAFNSGGGAALGTSPNPIFTNDSASDGSQQGATSQNTIQVIIQGNVVGNREFIDELIDGIKEQVADNDVILIGSSSRNGQDLRDA